MQSGAPGEQELARGIIGKRRWETGIEVEGGWDAHREVLQARAAFRDVLMWRDFDDGRRRYLSVSGEPVFDAKGRFAGYRGIGRDITQHKRGELLLRMEHTVTRCLAEASAPAEGVQGALRAICESEGWDWCEFRRVDAAGSNHAAADLEIPVPSGGRVAGMLAFGSRKFRRPDEPLLQALSALATQLGLYLERTESEARLRESEERFRRTFELAASGIANIGLDRRFLRVNRRLCEIFGYPESELIGKTGREISHPEDADVINAQRPRLYAGEIDTVRLDKRYLRKDGSTVWVTVTLALERDAAGKPLYEIAVYDDVTARKAAEAALRESEERFRSLTEMSSDFFWETDAAHRFLYVVHGPGYPGKLGRGVIGKAPWDVPATHPDQAGWAAMRAMMDAHSTFRDFEFARPWSGGSVRYFSVNGEPHFAADGRFLGYRGVGRDITEVALARERIASLAFQDALTGLGNRASLAAALQQAIERTRRRGSKLAGLFVDLDGLKQVNDAHGHDSGDRLLAEVARRLRRNVRAGDPVARLGGDEFFAVVEDVHDVAPVERLAQKLLAAIAEPYDVGGGREVRVSASIGISLFPDDAAGADALMKHADTAMYAAKEAGKNAYRFFGALGGGAGG